MIVTTVLVCTVMGVTAGLFIGKLYWDDEHRYYVHGTMPWGDKPSGWLHDGWVCVPDYLFEGSGAERAYSDTQLLSPRTKAAAREER
jgi:hypothetical protein